MFMTIFCSSLLFRDLGECLEKNNASFRYLLIYSISL